MGSGPRELDDTAAATPAPALEETAVSGDRAPATAAAGPTLPEVSPRRYSIAGEVGRGGLGRILRARDIYLDRTVALKELLGVDERARRRFVREALITARLQHPSIVPVYEAGRWPDHAPFYAMKLVAGKPLHDVLAGLGALDARLALLPTVLAVADAIAYAHSEKIVHRDLKPHNVLVGAFGETVVIDWGLAKDLAVDDDDALDAGPYRSAAADQTVDGAVLGTPAYMAPEQAAGHDIDARADVYALGAMLYHVVSGRAPHTGDSMDQMIGRVVAGEIAPIATVEPDVPADLAAIIAKAMARAPADRYPSARELADDLRRFTTGQLVGAHRYTLGERARRWLRRHRAVAVVAAAALIVLAAFGTWSIRRIVVESTRADRERDTAVARAHDAVDNGNRATLAQARAALARDPAEALAWLAHLDPDGPGWDAARVVAADALARPRLTHVIDGLPTTTLAWSAGGDGRRLLAFDNEVVTVVDLEQDRARTYDLHTDEASALTWVMCHDGHHAYGFTSVGPADSAYELDLDSGNVVTRDGTEPNGWIGAQACFDRWRFEHNPLTDDHLAWWDAHARAVRMLAPRGIAGAWQAPDARHALALDEHGVLTWWDPEHDRHEVLTTVPAHHGDAWPAMSDDGRVAVWVWEPLMVVIAGAGGAPLEPATGDVAAVAPDGSQLAIAGGEDAGLIPAIDLFDRDVARDGRLEVRGRVSGLLYSSDGQWLAAFGERAAVWSVPTRVRTELGEDPDGGALLIPGHRIARWAPDGTLRVWDLAAPRVVSPIDGLRSAWSRDGRWLVTSSIERYRRVDLRHEFPDEDVAASAIGALAEIDHGAVADDGTTLLAAGGKVWSWKRGAAPVLMGAIPGNMYPFLRWSSAGVAHGIDGDGIVALDAGGSRTIWRSRTAEPWQAESPDLRWVAVGDPTGATRTVRIVDTTTGVEVEVPGSSTRAIAFSSDDRWVATAAAGGTGVVVWDLGARRAHTIATPHVRPDGIRFSDDDRLIAVLASASIAVLDRDGGVTRTLDMGGADIEDLAFDPQGERLAVATSHDARMWDLRSGEGRVVADAPAKLVRFDGDQLVIALDRAVIAVPDDLPRDPHALSAALRALPYELDDAPGTARVRMRR